MLMSEPVLGSSFVKYNFITAQHSTYLNFGVKQLPAEIWLKDFWYDLVCTVEQSKNQ